MALLSNKLKNLSLNDDDGSGPAKLGKSVEQKYQKISQHEHVLKRPDTYVGSTQPVSQNIWVWDNEAKRMENREVTYSKALYKIFDEILVNAADHAQRDAGMTMLKVDIERENNRITVWNNGTGIPIEWHKKEKCYVPELIFGHLLTSSNYDDDEEKTVGGRNGFGAKLANIFSTEFVVETASSKSSKKYKQTFYDNMNRKDEPEIKSVSRKEDWTKISFTPDFERFEMTGLDDDMIAIMHKRVYDVAGCNPKIKVLLDGERVPIKSFKDYVSLYTKDAPVFYERLSDRWEVAIAPSDGQLMQVSFVNSICTVKGGTHVGHVADQIAARIGETIAKKDKKIKVRPFQIKNQLSLFVNSLIVNPAFDSQTKETLTTKMSKFGSRWKFSEDLAKKVCKSEIITNVLDFAKFKQKRDMAKTDGKRNQGRLLGIQNFDDANKAGTKDSSKCTLILTEGLSAKALVVSAFSVIGRDYYGCFPLRGKLLNVREASHKQIMDNTEITNLKKILGLKSNVKYDRDNIKTLRYGHVLIMTDQDHDGSHIKGLLLNFFDHFWPGLLQIPGFLQEFITPIVKTWSEKEELLFYTQPEYTNWCSENPTKATKWDSKYLKGLGGSNAEDAKRYFSDLTRHLLKFRYGGDEDRKNIELAFSKQRTEDRKRWLSDFVPGTYFNYGEDDLTYTNFVNKELILFSMADNARSIPSVCDGFKPSQRKVLWGAFKKFGRKNFKQIKVGTLCGFVSENALYHHGEASLQATVIALAQSYVGSNNINLLFPGGQFGTRLQGGKDAASARYISTTLTRSANALFPALDEPLLKGQTEEGKVIEPEWYCPIIPMILVNGADGIGTGWSTSVPNYNPRDVIANIRRMIRGDEPVEMLPWYRGFKGTIVPVGNSKSFDVHGQLVKCEEDCTLKVKELPIGTWTSPYKEFLESNVVGLADASKNPFIKDIIDNTTEVDVCFTISTTATGYSQLMANNPHKKLKLTSTVATSNMVLFDSDGRLRKYETTSEIMREFFAVRLDLYNKRKAHMLKVMRLDALRLSNRARFIKMVIAREIILGNRRKKDLVAELREKNFDEIVESSKAATEEQGDEEESDEETVNNRLNGYDYLLSMRLWSLTKEKIDKLLKDLADKKQEIVVLEGTSPETLWEADLKNLEVVLVQNDKDAAKHAAEVAKLAYEARMKQSGKGKGRKGKAKAPVYTDGASDNEEEIPPPVARSVAVRKPRKPKAEPKLEPKPVRAKKEARVVKKEPKKRGSPKLEDEFAEMDLGDESDDNMDDIPVQSRRANPRRQAAKVKYADSESEGDDEDEDDDFEDEFVEEIAPAHSRKGNARKKSLIVVDAGAEDDEMEEAPSKAPVKREPKKNVKIIDDSSSDDEDEDDDEEELTFAERVARKAKGNRVTFMKKSDPDDEVAEVPKQKPKAKAKPAPRQGKSRAASTRAKGVESDSENEIEEDEIVEVEEVVKPKAKASVKAAAKRQTAKSRAKVVEVESEESEDEENESEEEAEDAGEEVVRRATKRRAASRVKIIEDSEDDDGEDSDDSFELSDDDDFVVDSPMVAKKKRAPRGAWKTPTKPAGCKSSRR